MSAQDYSTRVSIRLVWDDQAGVTPGWYGELIEDGEVRRHTEMIGEPDLDDLGEDQRDEAMARLHEEWIR